jgi:hypothetical protein
LGDSEVPRHPPSSIDDEGSESDEPESGDRDRSGTDANPREPARQLDRDSIEAALTALNAGDLESAKAMLERLRAP